jgi:serine/threonine-protein kinase
MTDQQLGRYQLLGELGKGAMGVVYFARDPHLDRMVAVKTIRMASLTADQAAAYERRFLTEARSAARLRHPAIVNVYDAGQDAEVSYLVMELVNGINLKHCLNNGVQFSVAGAVRLTMEVLAGLEHAHAHRIIHRDIKPENMLLEAQGAIKLTDFGIAKIQDGTDNGTQVSGQAIGTPRYMSPEQIRGLEVDARSDLFSTGVLLYELLSSTLPFDGSTPMAVAASILHEAPVPVSQRVVGLTPLLDEVLAQALAKRASDRFQSASVFLAALHRVWAEGMGLPDVALQNPVVSAKELVQADSVGILNWLFQRHADAQRVQTTPAPGVAAPAAPDQPGTTDGKAIPSAGIAGADPTQALTERIQFDNDTLWAPTPPTSQPVKGWTDGPAASSTGRRRSGQWPVLALVLVLLVAAAVTLGLTVFRKAAPVDALPPAPAAPVAAPVRPVPETTPQTPAAAEPPDANAARPSGGEPAPKPKLVPAPMSTPAPRPVKSLVNSPAPGGSAPVVAVPEKPANVSPPVSAAACSRLLEKASSGEPLNAQEQREMMSSCR